jgi:cytochrome c peroxidase
MRNFATKGGQEGQGKKSNFGLWATLAAAGIGAGGGYYYWSTTSGGNEAFGKKKCLPVCKVDYQKVYNSIAEILEGDYDDGSYGPVLVRLAWHASGTYDKNIGDGGSNKATMRFDPEASHGGNAGLKIARDKLEPIKAKYPGISYGDLWTLAGVCAVQEMGGPIIPWRPGRVDGTAEDCTPDGRLPDGGNPSPKHPRDIFYRMGFNDQEIVALIGAHTLGRCHPDRSGFEGPWTNSPTTFSNSFFVELLGRKWVEKNWKGPKQFVDKESGELMMLPADMAFLCDKEFKKHVEIYGKDEKKFFEDFAAAWKKLLELGVPFKEGTQEYKFKPTS